MKEEERRIVCSRFSQSKPKYVATNMGGVEGLE